MRRRQAFGPSNASVVHRSSRCGSEVDGYYHCKLRGRHLAGSFFGWLLIATTVLGTTAAGANTAASQSMGQRAQPQATDATETQRFKNGCNDYDAGRMSDDAFNCVSVLATAMELIVIFQAKSDIKGLSICILYDPAHPRLTKDYVKLINQYPTLMDDKEPISVGLLRILARAFPCGLDRPGKSKGLRAAFEIRPHVGTPLAGCYCSSRANLLASCSAVACSTRSGPNRRPARFSK